MAGSGLPFQIAAEHRVDRSGDPRRLAAALAAGRTVYLPQVHQVLPRVMRLMVALRAAFFRPGRGGAREECSFLFIVEGTGRPGMGLHHDGGVDAFWLQLEGRRTVTIGPPGRARHARGARRPRQPGRAAGRAGGPSISSRARCSTCRPGRRTRVVCRRRSLARHAHVGARGIGAGALGSRRVPAGRAPRVGRGVRIRGADPAARAPLPSGPRSRSPRAARRGSPARPRLHARRRRVPVSPRRPAAWPMHLALMPWLSPRASARRRARGPGRRRASRPSRPAAPHPPDASRRARRLALRLSPRSGRRGARAPGSRRDRPCYSGARTP